MLCVLQSIILPGSSHDHGHRGEGGVTRLAEADAVIAAIRDVVEAVREGTRISGTEKTGS